MTARQPRTWRKSSHSGNGGNCVEVTEIDCGLDWAQAACAGVSWL